MTSSSGDELVDEVDELDRVVRVISRAEMRATGLRHRAVYLLVRSGAGELLVHQRSFDKDIAPGSWDLAVGGVVGSGESYESAATRELAEEIGLSGVTIAPIGTGRFDAPFRSLHVIGRVFEVRSDGPFTFADGEVIAAEWVAVGEVAAMLARRRFCTDSLALCLPLLGVPVPHES